MVGNNAKDGAAVTESVWDRSRPPALGPCARRVRVELGARRDSAAGWSYRDPAIESGHGTAGW